MKKIDNSVKSHSFKSFTKFEWQVIMDEVLSLVPHYTLTENKVK